MAILEHTIPDAKAPERLVYILQNVQGSSGGTARYCLTTDDGATLISKFVELREGFFNITEAFGLGSPLTMNALDAVGDGRVLTLSVMDLSPGCEAAESIITRNVLDGADRHGRVVLTVDIGCGPTDGQDR